jgi:hypothetical protein
MIRFFARGVAVAAFCAMQGCGGLATTMMLNAGSLYNLDGDPDGELARCEATGTSTKDCCAAHRVAACQSVAEARGPD